jgi:FKBP-type peptidyl-prolyl cis-trans isomerase FkpA
MSQGSTDRSGKLCGGVAALALVLAMAWMTGCAPPRPASPATTTTPENQVSELQVQDLVVGQGAEATAGSKVTVHYSGWLYDQGATDHKGKPFDSSRESGRPSSFTLGARQVIAGWDQGVAGMRVGGQRRLVIPAALAYGDRGAGGVIPPGATLVFDVELLDVQPPR